MQNLPGAVASFLAYALAASGILVLTVGVACGIIRMPDVHARSHAAAKALLLGTVLLLAGLVVATQDPTIIWDPSIILRVVLIGVFVLLTLPGVSRGLGRGAARRGRTKEDQDAMDELGDGPEDEPK